MLVYNPNTGQYEDDEEERRRRLQAEQAQAQDQENGLSQSAMPGGTAYSDIPGALYDKKMADLENRYAGVTQMFEDPAAAMKKRIMAGPGEDSEVAAPTPVKQTITTDPVTGEQRMKIEGSVQDLTAANPLTPTVSGPAVPTAAAAPTAQPSAQMSPAQMSQAPGAPVGPQQTTDPAEIQRRQEAMRAMIAQQQPAAGQPAPAPAPAQATAPTAVPQPAPAPQPAQPIAAVPGANLSQIAQAGNIPAAIDPNAAMPDIGAPPVPGPGVQVASTMPGAGVAEAAAAQQAQQAAQVNPAYTPTAERETQALTQEQTNRQSVVDARNQKDPAQRRAAYARLLADDTVDEGTKNLANRLISEDYIRERKFEKANRDIESATETDLARYMREQKKEGSYVKAILLARLGLTKLADKEMELISPTLTMSTQVDSEGKRYSVETDTQGKIQRAFGPGGSRASQEEIAGLQAAAMPTKSFLLPQSGGGLMQKTIIGPDGKEQVITGQVFTDPITKDTYFQAGKTRYDTTGLSTPSQNVQNVYGAAGAGQQGKQAAQTGTNFIGGQGGGGSGGAEPAANVPATTTADPAAARRAQTDIESLDKEIKRLKPNAPGAAKTLETLQTERAAAQQRLQAASGTGGVPQTTGAGGQLPTENFLQYQERLKRESATAQAAATANIDLSKEERSNFLTYEEKDIIPKADASSNISRIRKQQLKGPDGILNNKEIIGIMSGQGSAGVELANLIRDTVTGGIKDDELSRRVNALGLNQRQRDVVYNQLSLNNSLAPETLKANAGGGSVSDAEQTANRRNNIDITKVPVYTAITMLSRDQFDKDTTVARQAFRTANPNLTTVRAFNDAWGREKERLQGEYDRIYDARAQYIAKHSPKGSDPNVITFAYKQFPVPEFSRDGGWNYGTDYARNAARKKPPIGTFDR